MKKIKIVVENTLGNFKGMEERTLNISVKDHEKMIKETLAYWDKVTDSDTRLVSFKIVGRDKHLKYYDKTNQVPSSEPF